MISVAELAWVAGFIEGEGCFYFSPKTAHISFMVCAAQVQRWPLDQLQKLVGGKIGRIAPRKGKGHWAWNLTGPRGVGLALTLFSAMSPDRRQKIKELLLVWKKTAPMAPKHVERFWRLYGHV